MVQETLDLQLPGKLLGYFLLSQQFLLDYFESAQELGSLLSCQVHSTVFARPQVFYLLEIVYTEPLLFFLAPGFLNPLGRRVNLLGVPHVELAFLHVAVAAAERIR